MHTLLRDVRLHELVSAHRIFVASKMSVLQISVLPSCIYHRGMSLSESSDDEAVEFNIYSHLLFVMLFNEFIRIF